MLYVKRCEYWVPDGASSYGWYTLYSPDGKNWFANANDAWEFLYKEKKRA